MEQLEKLGINEDDIGLDVIKSSHKDPGVKPPGPGLKPPEEKGNKKFLNYFLTLFKCYVINIIIFYHYRRTEIRLDHSGPCNV